MSIVDELPRGFSNMVMQDCKSIPKSTISQSIPSYQKNGEIKRYNVTRL
jgi:hypothetical protein